MRHGPRQRRRQRHRRVYVSAGLGSQQGAPAVQEGRGSRVAAGGSRQRETAHQSTIRLAEVMQWDCTRIEVNSAYDIVLLQRLRPDIRQGMGFPLAIATADAQMGSRVVA